MNSTLNLRHFLYNKLFLFLIFAVLGSLALLSSRLLPDYRTIYIKGNSVNVLIASTVALQEKGLSGFEKLEKNEGMLFVFSSPGKQGFWMKDMLFPIDIMWIDSDGRLVDVWERATPESYPEIRFPSQNAQYVLETNAGFFKEKDLKVGDVLELK